MRLANPSTAHCETAEGDFTLGNNATKIFDTIIQGHPSALEYYLVDDSWELQ